MKKIFSNPIKKKKSTGKFAWLLATLVLVLGGLWWHWYDHTKKTMKETPVPAFEIKAVVPLKSAATAPPIKRKTRLVRVFFKKKTRKPHVSQSQWNHWGAAPYAHSFAEACRKAPKAIDDMNLPQPVKEHFKKVLGADCKGGREAWYTPGMQLEQVTSGPDRNHGSDWVMNDVPVAKLLVLRSPGGRSYRPGSVAETARVQEWSWTYEGKLYVWIIWHVCFNEGWRFGSPVLACATVKYAGKPGVEYRFAVLTQKRLPASACWQLCDGDDCAAPPSPCDDNCNWIGPRQIVPAGFKPLYTGKYIARYSHQSLRFPLGVEQSYIVLCDTSPRLGQSDSWVVQPDAWKNGAVAIVRVPYGGQKWPVWGSDAIDLSKFRSR